MSSENGKFILTVIDNKVFTFHAETYIAIRSKFRIIGHLVGVIPGHSRNTNLKGLPAVYNYYEVMLLLENNAITLVDNNHLRRPPSLEEQSLYLEFIAGQKELQLNELISIKLDIFRKHESSILKGKGIDKSASGNSAEFDKFIQTEVGKIKDLELRDPYVQVPTSHYINSTEMNYIPKEFIREKIDMEKYRIFADLWNRNKYITLGDSFGGDFLLYPGDPMNFHASHIVHIIQHCKSDLAPLQLVSFGRLAVNVNKKCILAYVDENDQIIYQTLEWKNYQNV